MRQLLHSMKSAICSTENPFKAALQAASIAIKQRQFLQVSSRGYLTATPPAAADTRLV